MAHHRPENLRDMLTPSKLKKCPGKENSVEFHIEGVPLVSCTEETNYGETRESETKEEGSSMKKEVARINFILKNLGQSTILCNPCTKKTRKELSTKSQERELAGLN